MSEPRTYRAEAVPDGDYWYVSVPSITRVTQARSLDELEPMTRDLIAIMEGIPADSFALAITVTFPAAASGQAQP